MGWMKTLSCGYFGLSVHNLSTRFSSIATNSIPLFFKAKERNLDEAASINCGS